MAIIDDFKAINERCRELSPTVMPKQAAAKVGRPVMRCTVCDDLGWVLGPHPVKGHKDVGYECAYCNNPKHFPNPFV